MADKINSKKNSNIRRKTENDLKDEIINSGLKYESSPEEEDDQRRNVWLKRMKRKRKSA